jgi:DNA-binding NarL/FixJ family response regulator
MVMSATVRVLLAEDHTLVRDGTRALLEAAGDILVVAEAAHGEAAVEMALRFRPDVALIDIGLPRLNGIEVIRRIKAALPDTRLLALTVHDEEEYVIAAILAGAVGYVLKNIPGRDLVKAVRSVLAGDSILDPEVVHQVFGRVAQTADTGIRREELLTDREREVLQIAASGCSNREIALRLSVSNRTIQCHLSHIFKKLNVVSRTEAVVVALKKGWVSLDESPISESSIQ